MPKTQILSGRVAGAAEPPLFDACQTGVVLRAVLGVELALGAGLLFGSAGLSAWVERLAFVTAGALPATLAWLLASCALKRWLARGRLSAQVACGAALGALAGLLACALLASFQVTAVAPWLASACSGALLAGGLTLALLWRARASMPAATTARLAELQARIRPHFLFNTLNTAIALVREDPARAERVLEDLADLFRHALADHGQLSSVSDEVALARGYLEIEQLRFGDRLRLHWSLEPRADAALLPALILQPLVENAVRHGVEPSVDGADVWVSTRLRGRALVEIEVRNTMPAGQGDAGHGLAQDNVRDRLRLLHDLEARFQTRIRDGVYSARIEVPLAGAPHT